MRFKVFAINRSPRPSSLSGWVVIFIGCVKSPCVIAAIEVDNERVSCSARKVLMVSRSARFAFPDRNRSPLARTRKNAPRITNTDSRRPVQSKISPACGLGRVCSRIRIPAIPVNKSKVERIIYTRILPSPFVT